MQPVRTAPRLETTQTLPATMERQPVTARLPQNLTLQLQEMQLMPVGTGAQHLETKPKQATPEAQQQGARQTRRAQTAPLPEIKRLRLVTLAPQWETPQMLQTKKALLPVMKRTQADAWELRREIKLTPAETEAQHLEMKPKQAASEAQRQEARQMHQAITAYL